MASSVWIGYLIGFVASNIWQISHPRHQEVFNERDVVFNETLFYDPDLPQPQDIPINLPSQTVETIQLPPAIQEANAESDPEPTFDDLYKGSRDTHPSILHTESHTEPIARAESNVDSSDPKTDCHGLPPQPPVTPDQTPLLESPEHQEDPGYTRPAISHEHIPGAFAESPPDTPNASTMDSFFIPSSSDRASPDEDPDPAAHQLSTELEEYNPAPHSSSGPSSTAGGVVAQPSQSQNTAQ